MAVISKVCIVLLALLLIATPATSHAHGGVVEEDDQCVIRIGYLKAHFKIYVPEKRGHRQFCEDIPVRGEAIFVMEYQHDDLSDAKIDLRIIRNLTGKGSYARIEDVNAIGDIEEATVSHAPAAVSPDVFMHLHRFDDDGEYIGIVSIARAEDDKSYTAVFPFEVGHTGFGTWPAIIVLLLVLQAGFWIMSRRRRHGIGHAALVLGLIALAPALANAADKGWVSDAGHFRVSYASSLEPISINTIHSWILHVESIDGDAIDGARIEIDGGMPKHNHGLPTAPRVTEELGDGDYRVDGMRFHMHGAWEIRLSIDGGEVRDSVTIPLDL